MGTLRLTNAAPGDVFSCGIAHHGARAGGPIAAVSKKITAGDGRSALSELNFWDAGDVTRRHPYLGGVANVAKQPAPTTIPSTRCA